MTPKKDSMDIDLMRLFQGLQAQMNAELLTTRENVPHPGTMGHGSELNWIDMLRNYLPKRYQVDAGFVLDSGNSRSEQIDILIYDRQYSPFLFNHKGVFYVPAESIYAVIEVKQDLGKAEIEYAGKKAASVRKLRRTTVEIKHAGGKHPPVTPFPILAGILTTGNRWSSLGHPFESAMRGLSAARRIDIGCALGGGAFEANYTKGKMMLVKSKPGDSLIFFFLRLVSRLQQLGTVPALDLMRYARSAGK